MQDDYADTHSGALAPQHAVVPLGDMDHRVVAAGWVRLWVRTRVYWWSLPHKAAPRCGLFPLVDDEGDSGQLPHDPLVVGSSPTRPTFSHQDAWQNSQWHEA